MTHQAGEGPGDGIKQPENGIVYPHPVLPLELPADDQADLREAT